MMRGGKVMFNDKTKAMRKQWYLDVDDETWTVAEVMDIFGYVIEDERQAFDIMMELGLQGSPINFKNRMLDIMDYLRSIGLKANLGDFRRRIYR